MTGIIDDIIAEAKETYSKMSLLQLLAEENIVAEFLHKKARDPLREKLQEILRLEILKKVR